MKVSSSSLTVSLLTLSLLALSLVSISFVLVLSQDDLEEVATSNSYVDHTESSPPEWDEFGDSDPKSDHELDPGSWRLIFEPDSSSYNEDTVKYYAAVEKMLAAAAGGEVRGMEEAVPRIEALAVETGNPHAQSVLGFLYGLGQMRERSKARSFLCHYFAADGGNLQSKMALAFTYSRQEMHDKAVKLYAELAEVAGNSFLISKDSPVIEPIRIHNGAEESMDGLRKSQGD